MKNNKTIMLSISILILLLVIVGYFHVPKFEKVEASSVQTKTVLESSFDYEFKANNDTIIWSSGETLEKGMPLYYYALEPSLTVYPSLLADNPEEGEIKVETYIGSFDKEGKHYWIKFIKNQQTGPTMVGAKELSPITIDVAELLEMASEIESELNSRKGSSGIPSILISLKSDLGGELFEHDISFTLESNGIIPPSAEQLSVRKEIAEEIPQTIMESRTLKDYLDCGYFLSYSGAIAFLFVTSFVTFKREPKSVYKRYNNWVSRATLTVDKEPEAYFDSLKELIDTAVELDKKVLFDYVKDIYYVLDGQNLYAHVKVTDEKISRRRSINH